MIKIMKNTMLLVTMLLIQTALFAQDEEVTEEDMMAYAELMIEVDSMKSAAKEQFSNLVKEHELMDGGRRYNELKKAMGDEGKLADIKATEAELAAYNELAAFNTQASADIKAAFSASVKDGIGARTYNAVKKKLKADPEFKAAYQAYYETLKAVEEEAEEEEAENK